VELAMPVKSTLAWSTSHFCVLNIPSNTKGKNMNTTENINPTPQPTNHIVKSVKFPPQPQEWKIVSLRECPTPEAMQLCETPTQAADYWRTHITQHPYFKIDVSYYS
jgi:hypothetical protein